MDYFKSPRRFKALGIVAVSMFLFVSIPLSVLKKKKKSLLHILFRLLRAAPGQLCVLSSLPNEGWDRRLKLIFLISAKTLIFPKLRCVFKKKYFKTEEANVDEGLHFVYSLSFLAAKLKRSSFASSLPLCRTWPACWSRSPASFWSALWGIVSQTSPSTCTRTTQPAPGLPPCWRVLRPEPTWWTWRWVRELKLQTG